MNYSKISIVTPSYNQGHFIEQTITSILDQNYTELEYIIVDGGSTDNTVEIIKKYEKHLKFWVSEKDNGQAHAINKGLKYCTGDIFNWLNSDDYLEPGALNKIVAAFNKPGVQAVAGVVRNFSSANQEFIQNEKLSANGLMCWHKGVKFVQPGVWLLKDLIDKCGGIDENFHYAFDWDLYIRYLYNFPAVKEIQDTLVHFRIHEHSKTTAFSQKFYEEELKIIRKINEIEAFGKLHDACNYKIQKASWTEITKKESVAKYNGLIKVLKLFSAMPAHKKVSFSRQTAGAIKAFLLNQVID